MRSSASPRNYDSPNNAKELALLGLPVFVGLAEDPICQPELYIYDKNDVKKSK